MAPCNETPETGLSLPMCHVTASGHLLVVSVTPESSSAWSLSGKHLTGLAPQHSRGHSLSRLALHHLLSIDRASSLQLAYAACLQALLASSWLPCASSWHRALSPLVTIPATVTWQDSGAVSGLKSQELCLPGLSVALLLPASCWDQIPLLSTSFFYLAPRVPAPMLCVGLGAADQSCRLWDGQRGQEGKAETPAWHRVGR